MTPRKKITPSSVRIHGSAIEMVRLADLKPYEKNARLHPEDQLVALEAIIRDSGFTAPLIIDPENGIIAGHGRALVAKRLKMALVPCVRVTGLSAARVKALRLSDNQAALRGGWDKDLLLGELTGLGAEGFDLGLTAFTPFELGQIKVPGFLPEEQIAEAEETPDLPAKPCVGLGQVWLLGEHRLAIGDSTDAALVSRLLAGANPHLMVTDPPYGVNYNPAWRGKAKRASTGKRLSLGVHAKGEVKNDDNADWRAAWAHFPGDVAYVWHAGVQGGAVHDSLEAAGFGIRSQIIWAKNNMVIGRGDYHWQHEPCLYAVREGKPGAYHGGRKQTTVWDIPKPMRSETGHGTQKPIECMRRPIINNSKPGDAVFDPFCGSGTTLIACEMEGRHCYAVELDLAYAELIIRRWEAYTSKTASREDGKTLADLAKPKRKAA